MEFERTDYRHESGGGKSHWKQFELNFTFYYVLYVTISITIIDDIINLYSQKCPSFCKSKIFY